MSYEALSYCWGDTEADHAIECNGRTIKVTQAVHQALRNLRISNHRHLWVDSICINQSDLQERNSQVQLLRKIYTSAKATLVWLGEEDSVEEKSLHHGKDDHIYPSIGDRSFGNRLVQFLSRPWFRRAWTFQETFLSKRLTLCFDREEVEWEIFWDSISTEIDRLNYGHNPSTSIRRALQLYTLTSTSRLKQFLHQHPIFSWAYADLDLSKIALAELPRILRFHATLHASDPRDKIYSLLGLLQPLGIELPAPDYSKSVEVVFREAAMELMKKVSPANDFSYFKVLDIDDLWQGGDKKTFTSYEFLNLTFKPLGNITLDQAQRLSLTLHDDSMKGHHAAFQTLAIHTTPMSVRDFSSEKIPAGVAASPGGALRNSLYADEGVDEDSLSEASMTSRSTMEIEIAYLSFFEKLVGYHKQLLLNLVLDHLKSKPDFGAVVTCNGGSSSSHNGPVGNEKSYAVGGGKDNCQQKPYSTDERGGNCRKRDDDEAEDEDEIERRPTKQLKDRSIDIRDRLACPYFQRNSQGPRLHASCRGLGFETIARLKEHLYRVHLIYLCDRCGDVFTKRPELTQHLRSQQMCDAKDWRATFDPAQGFDNQQQEDIRRRTIRTWNQIFKILFPNDPESSYPPQHHCNTQFVQMFDSFHAHYVLEIERLVPQRLMDAPFLSMLTRQQRDEASAAIADLVTDIHNEVVRSFRTDVLQATQSAQPEVAVVATAEFPDPNAAFLSYLYQIAPGGALPSIPFSFGDAEGDLTGILTNLGESGFTHSQNSASPSASGTQRDLWTVGSRGRADDGSNRLGRAMSFANQVGESGISEDTWSLVEGE